VEHWQALVLGIVEGITEYLPISSTGHLILAERLLGIGNDEAVRAFTICIQSGAILAVLSLYWPRVRQMAAGVVGRDVQGLRLLGLLFLAFLPAAVAGLALESRIDRWLFGLWPVTVAWLVGGLAILLVPVLRTGRTRGLALEQLDAGRAFVIGLFQCLALAPGTSRSLATIAGALLVGVGSRAAIEFSLLLGVLTLGAATAHKALQSGHAMVEHVGGLNLAIGLATSFVAAFLAVKWLVGWLNRHGLLVFGAYRVALAAVVALLLWKGLIDAGTNPG
jgi:undecaprenyl-diphosphatase